MKTRKTSAVLQGLDESSSQFYECLCEVFGLYTPFYLEATVNQRMINATFVGQGDIRQKLQKLEGFAGMNTSQLLEVAIKVFLNQDHAAKQETNRKMKKKVHLLAKALAKQSGGPCMLGLNRGRSSQHGWQLVPQGCPHPREESGKINLLLLPGWALEE
jgi:hypothetical protein